VSGRYAAGLDPIPTLGSCGIGGAAPASAPARSMKAGTVRSLVFTNSFASRGATNCFSVYLDAQGDENAAGFDFQFDTNLLTFVSAQLGADASSAQQLLVNRRELSQGIVGITLILPTDATFPAGRREIVSVCFAAKSGSNTVTTPLTFVDGVEAPIPAEITDVLGNPLAFGYQNGSATLVTDGDFMFTELNRQPGGEVNLRMFGPIGVWELQSSSNLFTWEPIFRLTNTSGQVDYTDATATNAAQRFYKAVKQ
jgi:hypothetical protein